jgi:hypothetical protein
MRCRVEPSSPPSLAVRVHREGAVDELNIWRQHQLTEHLIPTDSPVEPERVVGATQPVPQRPHPRGGDLQRPPRRTRRQATRTDDPDRRFQAEIQLGLPTGQPLPRRGLQRFQLCIVVGRPDVLDRARPVPGAVHDLYRPRSRRRPHGAHVGHDPTGYEIDLVRQFRRPRQRIRRSIPESHHKIDNLAKVTGRARASIERVCWRCPRS